MLSHWISEPSRSVICSRTSRWSSVVRIDSVIRQELALGPQLPLERGRLLGAGAAVESALAIAWAANDA